MLFENFVAESKEFFNSYYCYLSTQLQEGVLSIDDNVVIYPSMALFCQCGDYYIVELLGATNTYDGLISKRHKEKSIHRYLSQFELEDHQSLVHLDGSNNGFINLCMAQEYDVDEVARRFPLLELYPTKLVRVGGSGSPISFGDNFSSFFMSNCVLVNVNDGLFRCKNILTMFVVRKSINKRELHDTFKDSLSDKRLKFVHVASEAREKKLIVAGQLQSIYLFPSLHETTIGEFLKLHPKIIEDAFKATKFIYEPYLEWKEHDGTCEDTAINPDLLLEREDGNYDIYDLKTALLTKKSLTKAGRSRRRFIDYVEEGVAQLANYREYFSYSLNVKHAYEKYGIKVSLPKLVLVVGSWENAPIEEVKQARRRYPDVEIIDYDTLCHQFIGVEG
ncbi:DUF4263 domain-containing protein [Cobetia sp. MB87]|uniref:DUF4263 domain-containing protein n=1 Tax=Cobetia sp. MB87 TaxID=2588451 RepID=UPI00140B257A|nr:DUF4263 domain-containing protein [Cobetia sp. MB87]NHH87057.1 hypothetical protein [Cobetia sp. MB87]